MPTRPQGKWCWAVPGRRNSKPPTARKASMATKCVALIPPPIVIAAEGSEENRESDEVRTVANTDRSLLDARPSRGHASANSLAVYSRPIRRAIGSSFLTLRGAARRQCIDVEGARHTRWRDISVGGCGGSSESQEPLLSSSGSSSLPRRPSSQRRDQRRSVVPAAPLALRSRRSTRIAARPLVRRRGEAHGGSELREVLRAG